MESKKYFQKQKKKTENCKVKEVVDDFVPHNTFVQINEQDL